MIMADFMERRSKRINRKAGNRKEKRGRGVFKKEDDGEGVKEEDKVNLATRGQKDKKS